MWERIKAWFIKNWFIIVNYLVIFISYSVIYGKDGVVFAEVLLGLWLFVSAAYGLMDLNQQPLRCKRSALTN